MLNIHRPAEAHFIELDCMLEMTVIAEIWRAHCRRRWRESRLHVVAFIRSRADMMAQAARRLFIDTGVARGFGRPAIFDATSMTRAPSAKAARLYSRLAPPALIESLRNAPMPRCFHIFSVLLARDSMLAALSPGDEDVIIDG